MKSNDEKLKIVGDFLDKMQIIENTGGRRASDDLNRFEKMKDLVYGLYLQGYQEGLEVNLKESENNGK